MSKNINAGLHSTKNLPTFRRGRETTHNFSKVNNLKKEEESLFSLIFNREN